MLAINEDGGVAKHQANDRRGRYNDARLEAAGLRSGGTTSLNAQLARSNRRSGESDLATQRCRSRVVGETFMLRVRNADEERRDRTST